MNSTQCVKEDRESEWVKEDCADSVHRRTAASDHSINALACRAISQAAGEPQPSFTIRGDFMQLGGGGAHGERSGRRGH